MEDLTRLGALELAARIRSGEVSAAAAVEAHIRRIEAVNGRLNAVVVRRYDEAQKEARAADSRGVSGPLGGVPITIKESFDVAGTPTTGGLTTRRHHRAAADSPLVARLKNAGAIVVAKTNVAQLLYFVESSNPLYGRVNNPWDETRTPGGSSGGEGAIIAAGGSPLGLGSDIGGSVRIPAHFCGISALKPTAGRMPPLGSINAQISPQEGVPDSAGLLARRVEDLSLAFSLLAAGLDSVDPSLPPVPLGEPAGVSLRGLRVGWYCDDGYVAAAPALRRAVAEAAAALRSRGVELIEWRPPELEEAVRLYAGLMGADGLASLRRLLRGGEVDLNIRVLLAIAARRSPVRQIAAAVGDALGQPRIGASARGFGRIGTDQYFRLLEDRRAYRARFFAALDGVDVLICPPMAGAAFPHGMNSRLGLANHYCMLFNLLGLPAGVVAATRVRPGEESDRPASRELSLRTQAAAERGSAGLPVGVQVAARPYREDLVLAVMAALEQHFRAQPDHPSAPPL
jgi:fatty acid amide hydrolase